MIIRGTDGPDRLHGTDAADQMSGLDGNDILSGRAGNDEILGGTGNDVLIGSQGMDALDGGDGDDVLKGGTRRQENGNMGAIDTLSGGNGRDRIVGGFDADYLTGGAGADRFIYRNVEDSRADRDDRIADFEQGSDKVSFRGELRAAADFHFIGQAEFSHTPGEVRYTVGGGESQIRVDLDGDGVMDFRIAFDGEIHFTRHDFSF